MTDVPQHMRALAGANEVRLARAKFHREVDALGSTEGFRRIAALIEEKPPCLSTLRILDLIQWIHRVGERRARRFMWQHSSDVRISERATVGSLTPRQRKSLARALREEVEPEAEAA